MAACYRLDPMRSRFSVQAFATGMLSVFGHSPTFLVGNFAGEIRSASGDIHDMALELIVQANSLTLTDQVSASDRKEIEERLQKDVLETSAFRQVTYQASHVVVEPTGPGQYHLRFDGRLSLHGVTCDLPVSGDLRLFADGLHLTGECPIRMPDYHIKPVTALGGSIRIKDEVRVHFDIAGFPEWS